MSTGDFFPEINNTNKMSIVTGVGLTTSTNWGTSAVQLELNLPTDPNFKRLADKVVELEKRLLVLHPNEQLHEKYPALKEAYDAYLIIERLVNGNYE